MLRRLWLYPPLAFARLGNSETPLDAFHWGPSDDALHGTGKTTITPAETLCIAKDGTVSSAIPKKIIFKDDIGFRPVCPFFELHGEWETPHGLLHGPITHHVLKEVGVTVERICWRVEVANLKPYIRTRDPLTRISALVELAGNDVSPRPLQGTSPLDGDNPLVPSGHYIPLGVVRLTQPTEAFPEFRLRFIPGRGNFYGPENLKSKWDVTLPAEHLFLNPRSSWCSWTPAADDPRASPGGQYANNGDGISLGLVEDACDGIITCSVEGTEVKPARARIVVAPPDYAPDRRPLVSLADGLKDRVDRAEVHDVEYLRDAELTGKEIRDLMERAYETMGLINLDVFNQRADEENLVIALSKGLPYKESDHYNFPTPVPTKDNPLPLTERGRQYHRRFISIEVLTDFVRKRPDLIAQWIRPPLGPDVFFDTKMPALMKGATGGPLHLTRRQYDLLKAWARKLHETHEGDS